MANKLKQNLEQFDGLPIRTRLILTFAAILVIFLAFQLAWYSQSNKTNKRLSSQLNSVDQQIRDYTQSQQEINSGVYNQRNDPKRRQLLELQQQVASVQNELERKTLSLVRPEAMAALLKEIIDNSQKLKLISLQKQLPQPLFDDSKEGEEPVVQFYRHPVMLVFEGSYQETQNFLQELENMKRKVNFEQFEFSVEQYPKSQITLVVSTYSMTRKWIGG